MLLRSSSAMASRMLRKGVCDALTDRLSTGIPDDHGTHYSLAETPSRPPRLAISRWPTRAVTSGTLTRRPAGSVSALYSSKPAQHPTLLFDHFRPLKVLLLLVIAIQKVNARLQPGHIQGN